MFQFDAKKLNSAFSRINFADAYASDLTKFLHCPSFVKTPQTTSAGEKLLHGSLFKVSLFGDNSIQSTY